MFSRRFPFENGAVLGAVGGVNAGNGLYAVKKLIFDEKKYTMARLLEALDADWVGYEDMQRDFKAQPKYGNAIKEVKAGKIDFKVDKTGIVHAAIGKVSFTPEQIYENAAEFLNAVAKLKPQSLKGTYMKSAAVCTTMSPGVKVDIKAFLNGAEK